MHLGSHGKEMVNKDKPTNINDGAVWFVNVGVKCRQHVRNGGLTYDPWGSSESWTSSHQENRMSDQSKWTFLPDLGWKHGEAYLWPGRSRSQAEICLQGRARLEHDGGLLVLWAGGDRAVGGGAGRGLPLEELQDGLDVWRHLGLQSEGQADGVVVMDSSSKHK